MFGVDIKEVTGVVGNRFLMIVYVPSLVFWGLFIALVAIGQGDLFTAIKTWDEQEAIFKTLQIMGFIVWVIFFANILSSQLNTILRLYEGYWDFPLGRYFQIQGQRRHQARLKKLENELQKNPKQYERIYLYYPLPTQPEQVMPTLLGNILKNAELYPHDRYRIDAVLIWPRLYYLLSDRFVQTVADARGALDFMLVISSLSVGFALLAGTYLLITGAAWLYFLVCFLGGLFTAWLAYKSALGSALLYAQQIKVAFDLYRNDLLKQMHISIPTTPEEEKMVWNDVVQLLYRNVREKPEM